MLYLKSCRKCGGDMYLEKDSYGVFRQCLQCGLIQDVAEPTRLAAPAPAVAGTADARGRKKKALAA